MNWVFKWSRLWFVFKGLKKECEDVGLIYVTHKRHKEQASVNTTMGFWYLEKLRNIMFIWETTSLWNGLRSLELVCFMKFGSNRKRRNEIFIWQDEENKDEVVWEWNATRIIWNKEGQSDEEQCLMMSFINCSLCWSVMGRMVQRRGKWAGFTRHMWGVEIH